MKNTRCSIHFPTFQNLLYAHSVLDEFECIKWSLIAKRHKLKFAMPLVHLSTLTINFNLEKWLVAKYMNGAQSTTLDKIVKNLLTQNNTKLQTPSPQKS